MSEEFIRLGHCVCVYLGFSSSRPLRRLPVFEEADQCLSDYAEVTSLSPESQEHIRHHFPVRSEVSELHHRRTPSQTVMLDADSQDTHDCLG